MGWTSIYQLFWCSPGVQGFDTLPYKLYVSLPEAIQVHVFNGKPQTEEGSELDRRAELRGDPMGSDKQQRGLPSAKLT
jgi:hypothetical protein